MPLCPSPRFSFALPCRRIVSRGTNLAQSARALAPHVILALAILTFFLPLPTATAQVNGFAQPVVVEQLTVSTTGGNCRVFLATVDLLDPRVSIRTTSALANPPVGADSTLTTVPAWRTSTGARVAINANFFATLSGGNSDILGLSVSNGVVVSPARLFGTGNPDPAIVFGSDRIAKVDYIAPGFTTGVHNAVAGIGPSNTDSVPGTFLVTDGQNTGATARVDPLNRNPRTAIGVSRDGTRLFLFVVDGRQTSSVGMTLPEVADFLIKRGVWRAINLDGGGSSSFVARLDNNTTLQNTPSDTGNVFRPVANHIGIMVNGTLAGGTERVRRPIRGAWLRPPGAPGQTGDLALLDSKMATLASSGIRDLFLESLFWGKEVGQTGLFPQHTITNNTGDYLAQAIQLANKNGLRLHAWCETGYLDFGTSPSALLTANPGWVVKNIDQTPDPQTGQPVTGDMDNQRFVNLGNPGVRTLLNSYFTEMATKYVGLEGLQADYHFFPLAPSGAAPWSYDDWARGEYQAQFGVDPQASANTAGTTYHANWLSWNRNNVTQALVQIADATRAVSPGIRFSSVAFADWNSAFHRSKMIDLPSWGTTNASDMYFFMAYFTISGTSPGQIAAGVTAIQNDVDRAKTALPGKRVIAGLANLTSALRLNVTQQLDAVKGRGVEDFSWFEANTMLANPSMLTMLNTWVTTTATKQLGDLNNDGYLDRRDINLFDTVFTGTPITPPGANIRYDLNADNIINATDRVELVRLFNRSAFGEDGVVDARDLRALNLARTPGTGSVPTILNRWDLNSDGKVDDADAQILRDAATVDLSLLTDVNSDGAFDIEDIYAQVLSPADVNRDGAIDALDANELVAQFRVIEADQGASPQR
jgi:uncharacterized lipoprotein YddW (UPF0748 family)